MASKFEQMDKEVNIKNAKKRGLPKQIPITVDLIKFLGYYWQKDAVIIAEGGIRFVYPLASMKRISLMMRSDASRISDLSPWFGERRPRIMSSSIANCSIC